MLLRCDCLLPFYCQTFCHKMSTELSVIFLYMFFTPIFQCQCYVTCHTLMLIIFHGGSGNCDFLNFICIIHVWFLFTFFLSYCSSSTFNLSSLFTSMAFQNSFSYCWLQIFISFFIIKSAFSTTLFSLSFSSSSFVLHSKQFNSQTSQMWWSTSFLFLFRKILPQ